MQQMGLSSCVTVHAVSGFVAPPRKRQVSGVV